MILQEHWAQDQTCQFNLVGLQTTVGQQILYKKGMVSINAQKTGSKHAKRWEQLQDSANLISLGREVLVSAPLKVSLSSERAPLEIQCTAQN